MADWAMRMIQAIWTALLAWLDHLLGVAWRVIRWNDSSSVRVGGEGGGKG